MLYKALISTYGASLAGKSTPLDDPVWHLEWSEDLQLFREYALDALQQAKVYLLDHLAASYADTLHDAVQQKAESIGVPAMVILGEVQLPNNVSWVEYPRSGANPPTSSRTRFSVKESCHDRTLRKMSRSRIEGSFF